MTERERVRKESAADPEPDEERLGLLLRAAYRAAEPSDALEQGVAELVAQHSARATRRGGSWGPLSRRWGAAVGALAAGALVIALGLMLARWDLNRGEQSGAPSIVVKPRPPQNAPGRGVVPQTQRRDGERRVVSGGPAGAEPPAYTVRTPPEGGLPNSAPVATEEAASRSPAGPVDDLSIVNRDPEAVTREWVIVPEDEWERIEERVRRTVRVRDDFVQIPFPRIAAASGPQIARAVESYKREAAIVDARLSREVTLQVKGMALSDVCDSLRAQTGIQLAAGRSVADDKVTIFCKKQPLRDVMRQVNRLFGFTWLRSGKEGEYRYELAQDLKSQLLEEELRNRDRNAALLDLDRKMNQYRPYLHLSPAEALARMKSASQEEKGRLWGFVSRWGLIQLYFRLSPTEMEILRTGQDLTFSSSPTPGQRPLPVDLSRFFIREGRIGLEPHPIGPPAATAVAGQARVIVWIRRSDLMEYLFGGSLMVDRPDNVGGFSTGNSIGAIAAGKSPSLQSPKNAAANASLAQDRALRPRITVGPQSSCRPGHGVHSATGAEAVADEGKETTAELKVTTADVLESLHRATGIPIVADYYTRLYAPGGVSIQNEPVFEVLNQLADRMRLRWRRDGDWLQFRSGSYYLDRLKEVPNRLLYHWAAARQQQGYLPLDGLMEIAQLTDAQLAGADMAAGARECFGLVEWDLARNKSLHPHLRFLAGLSAEQQRVAMTSRGFPFTRMSLAQQQQFLGMAFGSKPARPEELAQAAVQVQYTPSGWFQWVPPKPMQSSKEYVEPLPVVGRTREAVLQAARSTNPQVTPEQVAPTELKVVIAYMAGTPARRYAVRFIHVTPDSASEAGP